MGVMGGIYGVIDVIGNRIVEFLQDAREFPQLRNSGQIRHCAALVISKVLLMSKFRS